MPELVFYDQRLPLKRKWSDGASPPPTPLQLAPPPPPHRPLPRLPSLSAWANVQPSSAVFQSSSVPSPLLPSTSADKPVTKPPSPPAKPAAPMRNTSRERMKAEQAALRAQAATLETELSCLRQLHHERLSASLRSAGASSSSSSSSAPCDGLLGWQEMAQRHWDQRVAAERENKRLREAVNGLATEVKGLEALFNSRSSALMASLRQNAQLTSQIQELLHKCEATKRSPHASPRRTASDAKRIKAEPSQSQQQSPRDVACAMEAPQSPYGL